MDLVGQTVGTYHVRKRLGEGGIGIVYLAWDSVLGREVAIKILRPEYIEDSRLKRLIVKDAQTAARLGHPNIVTIYSVGIHDGRPYFAMEYLQGEWLRERIERARNTAHHIVPQEAARVAREVAKALDHAHRSGVAHLDVKPENIALVPDGRVVLTDFGIARHFGDSHRTHHGGLVGTILYMAPEQFDAKVGRIGPATDLYALGAVLYEMLTSRAPFRAQNLFAIMRMHLQAERPKPSKAEPRLGTRFDGVVERAMAIKPRKRYSRAWDFSRDVAAAADVTDIGPRPMRTLRGFVGDRRLIGVAAAVVGLGVVLVVAAMSQWFAAGGGPRATVTPTAELLADPPAVFPGVREVVTALPETATPFDGAAFKGTGFPTDTPGPEPTAPTALPTRTHGSFTPPGADGAPMLLAASQSSGCVQLAWQPAMDGDLVLACRGAGCVPTQGIFTGRSMYPWNPTTVFPDASRGETFRWTVRRDGVEANAAQFSWVGGDCGRRPNPTVAPNQPLPPPP